MPFKRAGRRGWYFQARTQTGWKSLGTHTRSKPLADRICGMWDALSSEHRAWDLLNPVLAGDRGIGELYDAWAATHGEVPAMRRLMEDVNLEPLIQEWLQAKTAHGLRPDTVSHLEHHIRWLIPQGSVLLRSSVTADFLSRGLARYPGKPATRRKVAADWSSFFGWLTRPKSVFSINPMRDVDRPKSPQSRIQFFELSEVERIVGAQIGSDRALFALLYGAGVEISVALGLRAADVDRSTHEVRAAGTKAHTRDRMCRVSDWAWPIFAEVLDGKLPTAPLWPHRSRWTASDKHRETVQALGLPAHPLKNARHHWAVRALRAGAPVAVVQNQLGHSSPMLTLSLYGRFIPQASDRAHWEQQATQRDQRLREAR